MENVSYEGVAEGRQDIAIQDGGHKSTDSKNGEIIIYATSPEGGTLPTSPKQGNGEIYHDISDKSEKSEYAYAYAEANSEDKTNSPKPEGTEYAYAYADVDSDNAPQKPRESGYTYVDVDLNAQTASNPSNAMKGIDEKGKDEEGWKNNTLYGKGDGDEGHSVGWKDNTVYAATDNDGKSEEGWEDNTVYAAN